MIPTEQLLCQRSVSNPSVQLCFLTGSNVRSKCSIQKGSSPIDVSADGVSTFGYGCVNLSTNDGRSLLTGLCILSCLSFVFLLSSSPLYLSRCLPSSPLVLLRPGEAQALLFVNIHRTTGTLYSLRLGCPAAFTARISSDQPFLA